MRFISRLTDYGSYQVRLPVPQDHREEPYWSRTFNWSHCGGQESALQQAQEWRDRTGRELWGELWLLLHYKPPHLGCQFRRANNASGHIGVRRILQKGNPAWYAQWQEGKPGQRRTRRFVAIDKHGEEKALALAIEARNEGIQRDFDALAREDTS